jgi:hypothetical protein
MHQIGAGQFAHSTGREVRNICKFGSRWPPFSLRLFTALYPLVYGPVETIIFDGT